jgi:hypothetical protein
MEARVKRVGEEIEEVRREGVDKKAKIKVIDNEYGY